MSERRYEEEEIQEIFEVATARKDTPSRALGGEAGLTLDELKDIGREVGIAPERLAEAALALDRPTDSVISLSVRRTIPLPRDLTEDEWERLVADLRSTFDAPGKIHRHGGLKGWTNGNLHAYVEPSESGYHLRMGSTKENARVLFTAGAALFGLALVILLLFLLTGDMGDPRAIRVPGLLTALALGHLGAGALQLPGWKRKRRLQMEGIGTRLTASLEAPPPGA